MHKRLDLMIINRSFWPIYPVIGEALMRFAEQEASRLSVGVILQDHVDIRKHLAIEKRGKKVHFYPGYAFSISGSSIIRRAFDAIFFMLWVFAILVFKRPKKVYVSTDPPVIVPFIVMIYSKIFKAKYVYHLQDIHPEAANVVIPVKPILYKLLRWMDSVTMRHAHLLMTITHEMAEEIKQRSGTRSNIEILSNPSVSFDNITIPALKQRGFTFCGNAGRLQRIPLLIEAIDQYHSEGGQLPFVFAGGGVYANELKILSEKHEQVTYLGVITASEAAQLNADYQWALLPIEDEVTRFAFPSKSSSYVFSGAEIIAICGRQTSVAQWVIENKVGRVVEPSVESLCTLFHNIEHQQIDKNDSDEDRYSLKARLGFDVFLNRLTVLLITEGVKENV